MLRAHFLAFRYYSEFICVCFFAFVKKKYWWITLIFFHAESLYIRHMFQIHIYRAITLVCALAPPQETHMKARTTHFTLKLFVFLYVNHVARPKFLNSKQLHHAIVCLLTFIFALETKWNHPFAAAVDESLCAIDMQPVVRHFHRARSLVLPATR